ncbi:hypothetical protein MRX96_030544 [Rhipicephalus microplus]
MIEGRGSDRRDEEAPRDVTPPLNSGMAHFHPNGAAQRHALFRVSMRVLAWRLRRGPQQVHTIRLRLESTRHDGGTLRNTAPRAVRS